MTQPNSLCIDGKDDGHRETAPHQGATILHRLNKTHSAPLSCAVSPEEGGFCRRFSVPYV